MPDITYYDILQIRNTATDDMIRSAYRRLAKRHHPDANPMNPTLAATRFRAIQDAYEHLRHPQKRAAYDQILKMKSWAPSASTNDNTTAGLSDLFTTTRRTIERLMRLMATPTARSTPLSTSAQQGKK